ncbi:MAG TPA: molybdopterin biosynthesis protein [Chloroflexi bacterium]|nr:molybdopterin biosynthesis protein [Chloroflexota bacterium]
MVKNMSVYLHDIPLNEAQARLQSALEAVDLWRVLGVEELPLDEHILGRVLAEPVWAKISSPHYHASAMDGFAVCAIDTESAMPTSPVAIPTAVFTDGEIRTTYIDTGDPLPLWANAVIPIEKVEPLAENGQPASDSRQPHSIRIRAAVTPWSHVRPLGEDMVATQLVLPAGHTLRPVDLGAIAGCGHHTVKVARKPKVAILPTGTELKPIGEPVASGDIIEYNSLVLAAQVNGWGGEAARWSITPDNFEGIRSRVAEAAQSADLILLNAGSSAGSEDFSAGVVESLGELLVHGVAVRPGHPVILGMVARPRTADREQEDTVSHLSSVVPIIGVPGYPVSAALTGEIFVEPLIAQWLGRPSAQPYEIEANLTRKITSPGGDDDYVRVAVGRVGEKTLAAPVARGAGVITSLVQADGIVIIPRGSQGLPAGEKVKVRLYRSTAEIERTILAIGSHDITLDVIAQFLAARGRRLASANVGSLGGLVALRRGEAHLAGSHLLDPESGEYNLSYIRQYLPETPVRVVALVGREQGLLVPRGNPKGIQSLGDLRNPEVRFVNRQRGAGTRVLLDYHLGKIGLVPEAINGYHQEEFTHLSVAAAIASGRADCGLGIAAAAQALQLDFVPLFQERYDLVVPEVYAESDLLAPLWVLLEDLSFKSMVAGLPGYDIGVMGKLVAKVK